MNFIKKHKELCISILCALLPLLALSASGIRSYVLGNFAVSATYNTAIIFVYLVGCTLVFFSFIELTRCNTILKQKDSTKPAHLLGDANLVVFSPSHGQHDDTIASLYDSMKESVARKQQHRLSAVQNCANISTMIGLLGTFAGLSITIASVITLLERSQISSTTNDSDMLAIIVNVVSSLAEPLKGMNTAFVSSIYGVVSAILLGIMCSFLRSAFNKLSVTLRDANLDFLRDVKTRQTDGKTRILQIETAVDHLVRELKDDLTEFHQATLSIEEEKRQFMALLLAKMDDRHALREVFETDILASVQDSNNHLLQVKNGVELANQQLNTQSQAVQQLQENDVQQNSALQLIYSTELTSIDNQQQQHETLKQFQALNEKEFSSAQSAMKQGFTSATAQLDTLGETQAEHHRADTAQHQLTQALVESHTETFPPLFAQVASVQQTLHKEIIVLKNKEQ